MSWASKRKTRIEDVAYCLLGLFDVNMPLLYGEGDKAFLRLQEEIMKASTDHMLFAWFQSGGLGWVDCGLLTPSPEYFAGSSRFVRQKVRADWSLKPYSMTNRGFEIELELCQMEAGSGYRLAILNCISENSPSKNIAICLARSGYNEAYVGRKVVLYEGDFARIYCHKLEFLGYNNVASRSEKIYIRRGAMFMKK
jgi:hypothetical protein